MTLKIFLNTFVYGNTKFAVFQQEDDKPHQIISPTTHSDFDYGNYQHILEKQIVRLINGSDSTISIIVDWR